jgi:hypothetical protein
MPEPHDRRWPLFAGLAAGTAVVVVVAVLLLGGSETPTTTGPSAAYDFDADGRQDVVLGLNNAAKTGGVSSGVVMVGTAGGERTLFTGKEAAAPQPLAATDRFGTAVASGDFDRNGKADLAISAPGRKGISVLYDLRNRTDWIAANAVDPEPETEEGFGFALVAADFDHDRYADLAIGTPGSFKERQGYRLPQIQILFGGPDGLTTDHARGLTVLQAKSSPNPRARLNLPGIGTRLAAGDIDNDGNVDLVEGAPDEPRVGAGHLSYCAGTPDGPQACRGTLEESPTSSLAIANVNGDPYLDVIQGDAVDTDADATGVVRFWPGGEGGLGAKPKAELGQGSPRIDGEPQAGDEFGHDVIAADIDGDHLAEVIVAARSDDGGAGSVTVIRGDASEFGGSGGVLLEPPDRASGQLGATLSLLDIDDDNRLELFVGVKGTDSLDTALVEFPGVERGFGAGKVFDSGLGKLATSAKTSALRIGR